MGRAINVLLWRWPDDRECEARAVFVLGIEDERISEGRIFAPGQVDAVRSYVEDLQGRLGVEPVFVSVQAERASAWLQLWTVERESDPADDARCNPEWGA